MARFEVAGPATATGEVVLVGGGSVEVVVGRVAPVRGPAEAAEFALAPRVVVVGAAGIVVAPP